MCIVMNKSIETALAFLGSMGGLLWGGGYLAGMLFGAPLFVWSPLSLLGFIALLCALSLLLKNSRETTTTMKTIDGMRRNFNIIICVCIVPVGPFLMFWTMWDYIATFPFWAVVGLCMFMFVVQIMSVFAAILSKRMFVERAMRRLSGKQFV